MRKPKTKPAEAPADEPWTEKEKATRLRLLQTDYGQLFPRDATHFAASRADLAKYEAYLSKRFAEPYKEGQLINVWTDFLGFEAWDAAKRPKS